MRWAVVAACAATVWALPAAGQQAPPGTTPHPLLGTWESVVRSKGGIGRAFVLAADGSAMNVEMGMTPDARYVLDGTHLRVTEQDGTRTSSELTVTGDTLHWGPSGRARAFSRMPSESGGEGIVGRWASVGDGATGYLVFTADGIMQARVILESMAGTHSAKDDELTLTFANRPIRFRFAFTGDTLVLKPTRGRAERYVRGR